MIALSEFGEAAGFTRMAVSEADPKFSSQIMSSLASSFRAVELEQRHVYQHAGDGDVDPNRQRDACDARAWSPVGHVRLVEPALAFEEVEDGNGRNIVPDGREMDWIPKERRWVDSLFRDVVTKDRQ